MRKADGHNYAQLSTSWRDVISHSPRELPCFAVRRERKFRRHYDVEQGSQQSGGYKMSVKQPVLTPPHGGETVTSSGGSSVEMKVESSQSGGDYGAVLLTVRAGGEP